MCCSFVLSVSAYIQNAETYVLLDNCRMPRAVYCLTKSTALVLLWLFLMRLFYLDPPATIGHVKSYWISPYYMLFYIIYPFFGLLADVKFGKLKVALFSAMFALLISVLRLVANVLIDLNINVQIFAIILYILSALSRSAIVCFQISMASLAIDQLIDASSLTLTSFIWCHFGLQQLGFLVKYIVLCSLQHTSVYALFAPEGIHIVSILAVVISCCVFLNRTTFMQLSTRNPLILIGHVLNYARKTKYPRHRSALTYWLDDYPPRIDLGKTKYGGPFTEEEVENVKTFFRLIPVMLITLLVYIPAEPLGRFYSSASNTTQSIGECLVSSSYFCQYVIAVIFVPIKIIVFSRFRYKMKCFSTLFRFIGFGILLSILGKAVLPIFDYLAKSSSNETECIFSDSTNITSSQTKYYFLVDYRILLIPKALSGLGATFIIPGSFELLVAQAPIEMRGIIVGLFFSVSGLYDEIGLLLILPFKAFPSLWPSCEFYFFLVNFVVMLVSLVGVVIVGKWYKLRQRDDPFNPYSTVENFYDKDFDRRDKYKYEALEHCSVVIHDT